MRSLSLGYLKDAVFKKSSATILQLQQSVEEVCEEVTQEMRRKAWCSVM